MKEEEKNCFDDDGGDWFNGGSNQPWKSLMMMMKEEISVLYSLLHYTHFMLFDWYPNQIKKRKKKMMKGFDGLVGDAIHKFGSQCCTKH